MLHVSPLGQLYESSDITWLPWTILFQEVSTVISSFLHSSLLIGGIILSSLLMSLHREMLCAGSERQNHEPLGLTHIATTLGGMGPAVDVVAAVDPSLIML